MNFNIEDNMNISLDVGDTINIGGDTLPPVTAADNGKVLKVIDGDWAVGTDETGGGSGGDGLTEEAKQALLAIFTKVAFISDDGQEYYDALEDALYPEEPAVTLTSITAVYTQSGTVYDTDTLDSLKANLAITAHYSDGSSNTVSTYTLSGTLSPGTSTITATYEGKTATFSVTVTHSEVTLSSISVAYTQIGPVYTDTSLDIIKPDIVVTGHYSDGSTATIPNTDVALSGTLTEGESTVTVTYQSKTATFNITVLAVELDSISATFTQGDALVGTQNTLDSLKSKLVVTAVYNSGTEATVPNADVTLSGTLAAGTSTITATYGGKTDTFDVTVASNLLWALENYAFNEESIDTGIALLSENRAFSLAMDITLDTNPTATGANGAKVRFWSVNDSSNNNIAFTYGKASETTAAYLLNIMGQYATNAGAASTGRKRFVITHAANSNAVTVKFRDKEATTTTSKTATATTFTTSDKTLNIGNVSWKTTYMLPKGTIAKAYVYDKVLTSAQINSFLGL